MCVSILSGQEVPPPANPAFLAPMVLLPSAHFLTIFILTSRSLAFGVRPASDRPGSQGTGSHCGCHMQGLRQALLLTCDQVVS